MKITILGAGAWGTALALALAGRHDVLLWGRNAEAMQRMAARRENTDYLPGFPLSERLQLSSELPQALAHAAGRDALLILATSVAGLRPMAMQLKSFPIPNVVWLCKGFEEHTRLLPHQVVREVLGEGVSGAALSGPSFAQEVARGLPCALTVASASAALCRQVVTALHGGGIRVYSTDDVVGVEVGGAVKNILAIATGVVDGLGLGLNARAALITRGLAEMTRLGVALGAQAETFMGLSGLGDLVLTATGDLSRNRRVGVLLAQGQPLPQVLASLGHVAEGVYCAHTVVARAARLGVEMPIASAVVELLDGRLLPADAVAALMQREPAAEKSS
jgi:glycerol-3-phosphate dehydrogenase (NAD(P)+)